jgi:hypothetical protein
MMSSQFDNFFVFRSEPLCIVVLVDTDAIILSSPPVDRLNEDADPPSKISVLFLESPSWSITSYAETSWYISSSSSSSSIIDTDIVIVVGKCCCFSTDT